MPALSMPNPSVCLHPATKVIFVISRMLLGLCNVGVCIVEFVFAEKQCCKGVVDPKLLIGPVERVRDFKGYVVMVNGFASLPFGTIYSSKDPMRAGEFKFLAFPQEFDRV